MGKDEFIIEGIYFGIEADPHTKEPTIYIYKRMQSNNYPDSQNVIKCGFIPLAKINGGEKEVLKETVSKLVEIVNQEIIKIFRI